MSGRPDTRQKCLKFAATGLAARIAFTWFAICGCRCFMAMSATIWCPSQPHAYARNGAIAKKRMAREYCSCLVFMVEPKFYRRGCEDYSYVQFLHGSGGPGRAFACSKRHVRLTDQ